MFQVYYTIFKLVVGTLSIISLFILYSLARELLAIRRAKKKGQKDLRIKKKSVEMGNKKILNEVSSQFARVPIIIIMF